MTFKHPAALAAVLALASSVSAETPPAAPAAPGGTLTIDRAVTMVLERDERARIADRDLASAEAQVDRARAFFFPDVTATGAYTFRGNPGEFQERHVLTGSLTVGLSLFDARATPLYRVAQASRDAADADRREAHRLLAFEAADAYLATLGTEAVVEAALHRVDFARQSLSDARARAEAQLASSNDVTKAELELATAERELRRAQGELAAARLNLGHLVGQSVDGPLAAPTALLATAPAADVAAEGLITQAQDRRLDLKAAAARARAARLFAVEPRRRWIPSLGAAGTVRSSSEAGITDERYDWNVTLSLSWQIWDGGERAADAADRDAQAAIAELGVDAAARRVALEVRTALTALARSRATTEQATLAVAAARKNVDETRELYTRGLARALEVADASARLFDAEVALARESYGLALAVLDLHAALGLDPLGREPTPGARS